MSAVISAAYAIWQKKSVKEKVLQAKADTIWRLRRVCMLKNSEINPKDLIGIP